MFRHTRRDKVWNKYTGQGGMASMQDTMREASQRWFRLVKRAQRPNEEVREVDNDRSKER